MIQSRIGSRLHALSSDFVSLAFVVLLLLIFSGAGCKSKNHTADPRLKQIDQLLNTQLPPGTPRARVQFFLNARGYRLEDSPDKNSVVALVRHIDTATLQPSTARVTFHFDSNNKLLSYELQSSPDTPALP
ncbi:MAG: hypothetical protein ACRD51_03405 [Candidatus Acidiferrum sp.]